MERKINKLMGHLMRGTISQNEFVTLVKKDLYKSRENDAKPIATNQ